MEVSQVKLLRKRKTKLSEEKKHKKLKTDDLEEEKRRYKYI